MLLECTLDLGALSMPSITLCLIDICLSALIRYLRYRCKEDMTEIHAKSEPYALFKKLVAEAGLKRKTDGHSYIEGVGYMAHW